MPLCRTAIAFVSVATLLAACTPTGINGPGSSTSPTTTSHPLAATQLVGRTFADAEAVLRRTTIATSDVGTRFRGAEAYRITADGTITPMNTAEAAPLTVRAATFAGSTASPMDDVRAGLVVADEGATEPKPGTEEYRNLEDRLLDAMGLQPPRATTVSYLWIDGGDSIEDAFWRFVDRTVRQLPLTRDTTAALVGRALPPVARTNAGQYGAADDKTWVDGVRLHRVLVVEAPATNSWLNTTFDIAAQSRVCAVNIEDVLRARFTVTPARADDVHPLGEPTPHRATVAGGVLDFLPDHRLHHVRHCRPESSVIPRRHAEPADRYLTPRRG